VGRSRASPAQSCAASLFQVRVTRFDTLDPSETLQGSDGGYARRSAFVARSGLSLQRARSISADAASCLFPSFSDPSRIDCAMPDLPDWQRRAADKRAAQLELIPPAWRLPAPSTSLLPSDVRDVPHTSGILSDAELVITAETDAQVVLDKISRGEWTSTAVATAFCKRAAIAQQLVRLSPNLPSHHSTEPLRP